MEREVLSNHFSTEEEAIAEIRAAGFYPVATDIPAETNDFHYHDFDAFTYVLDGSLEVTIKDTGEVYTLRKGDKSAAPAGVVHRESHDGFRAVFGLSVDPTTLIMPINKPPADA